MSEKIDTKNHPTVKALIEHRDRLNISDAILSRRYIGISKTTWSQLQSGTYPAQDPSAMLDRCAAALQILIDESERADAGKTNSVIELQHIRAVVSAVKGCFGAPQNRLVVFLAPSGGGKTTLLRKLSETYRSAAVCGEASETWRNSYFNCAADIAQWLGIDEEFSNPRQVENAVIDNLLETPRVLCIDEGNYLGAAAMNFIKLILNRTQTRVVLIAIPELWTRMVEKAAKEAEQLRRRTHAKVVVTEVPLSDARKFVAAKLASYDPKAPDEKEIIAAIVAAANRFGLFDTVARICTEMEAEGSGKEMTSDVVTAAIRRVEALR